ncbi:MAG TPA: nuclear transport factor 2 family protein [Gammaproteobacteria bacterium]|nr:nuclear transport factor 2 family protein [Gammaproteobacteria bacterium]
MAKEKWLTDLFKNIDSKDSAAFAKFLSEDVEFRFGNSPVIKDRKAITETVEAFFKSIRGLHHEITQTWIQADSVICHGMVTYTRHDSTTLTVPFANIFTLSSNLVSRYLIFVDLSALYSSVGA